MNITVESSPQRTTQILGQQWLILIHQLPPKPDYLRVKVRRRLLGLGAIALKSTVYVLPLNDGTMEDFHWLRGEILADQGEATVVAGRIIAGITEDELKEQFREVSNAGYAELINAVSASGGGAADLDRFRRHFETIEARDHFGAPGRAAAREALQRLEARTEIPTERPGKVPSASRPSGATWVTRKGVFVDRMASAWLIRRFIDGGARFKFVPPQGYRPEAGELRFDMFEGEFTHEKGGCTFETLLSHFQIDDPALAGLGEIVHDIDCKDDKFGRPETVWVTSLLRGIVLTHPSDPARIEAGMTLFDALHASLGEKAGGM